MRSLGTGQQGGWLRPRFLQATLLALAAFSTTGCYAPLLSPGIPACELPDSFRTPTRSNLPRLNLAELTIPHTSGTVTEGDLLEVRVHGLEEGAATPIQVRVLDDGTVALPLVGSIRVANKSLPAAQQQIAKAYEGGGFLNTAQIAIHIVEPAMVEVVVMGQVNQPGVYSMPRNAADIGRAIALAGGLTDVAGDVVEVHRNGRDQQQLQTKYHEQRERFVVRAQSPDGVLQITEASFTDLVDQPKESGQIATGLAWKPSPIVGEPLPQQPVAPPPPAPPASSEGPATGPLFELPTAAARPAGSAIPAQPILKQPIHAQAATELPPTEIRIPLRGHNIRGLSPDEVRLHDGDVIQIPKRRDQVFYVVGPLNQGNRQTFNVSDRDLRQIGGGFLLPLDREIDVVTGVAMAGYIDPITSPTTVTVQRRKPNGGSLLIRVDLIAARSDSRETILLRPDDIVYLNPDGAWWSRRFFDQVAPQIFTLPYRFWIQDLIVPSASPL